MLTALMEQMVNGAMMGMIYVLVALGMVLIYGVMGVLNFAQGMVLTAGGYVCLLVFTRLVPSYWLALLLAVVTLAATGLLLERLVFRRLRGNVQMQIVASLGLILVIQNGLVALFGASGLQMRVGPADTLLRLGPLTFTMQHVLIIGVVTAAVGVLFGFLRFTRLGTALRATSQNPEAARVVGIDPDRIYLLTFAIACGLAGLGGALLGPLYLVYPQMGELPLLKALAAIVLGGMASVPGAVVGGLAIGIVEAVSTLFIATDYRDMVVFLVLVAALLLRPQGLFGVRVRGEA